MSQRIETWKAQHRLNDEIGSPYELNETSPNGDDGQHFIGSTGNKLVKCLILECITKQCRSPSQAYCCLEQRERHQYKLD